MLRPEVIEAPPRESPGRRLSSFLHRHPRLRLGLLLTPPLSWLLLAYLGSLAVLFVAAFWRLDPFTAEVVHDYGFQNFRQLWESDVYRAITQRTVADRRGGDRHRRRARVPDRLLHGEGRLAADAEPARRRDPAAALGELPRQGLRLADHPPGAGDPELGARAARALRPRLRERRHLARLLVPLAAVHDPAGLRGPRADPARRCSRRPSDLGAQGPADALARRPPARAARRSRPARSSPSR